MISRSRGRELSNPCCGDAPTDPIASLGTGSFGRVHLVRSRHNGRFYAVKVLNKEKVVRMKQVEHTNSEREMLVRVRHPFLVNLWGTFGDVHNLYMVMDFVAGGELFSLLRKSQVSPGFQDVKPPDSYPRSASPTRSPNSTRLKSPSLSTTYTPSTSSTAT
jgi:serine/threonine protein kinase